MSYALAMATVAFLLAILAGYPLIRFLRRMGVGKQIREEGPDTHMSKSGTPTMGGIMVWGSVFISTAVFNVLNNPSIVVPMATTAATGILGTIDDILGMRGDSAEGLTVRIKFAGLTLIAVVCAVGIYGALGIDYLFIPTISGRWHLGLFYVPLAALAIVATANAVNLTDGLDSLAGV